MEEFRLSLSIFVVIMFRILKLLRNIYNSLK